MGYTTYLKISLLKSMKQILDTQKAVSGSVQIYAFTWPCSQRHLNFKHDLLNENPCYTDPSQRSRITVC